MVSVGESIKRLAARAITMDRDSLDLSADVALCRRQLPEARKYRRKAVRREELLNGAFKGVEVKPRFGYREERLTRRSFPPR